MRKAMEHAGMSVQGMADYLGVSRNTVSTWLHDRINPSRQTLMLWALRTGVDLVWITSGDAGSGVGGDRSTGWFSRHAPKRRTLRPVDHLTGSPANHPFTRAA